MNMEIQIANVGKIFGGFDRATIARGASRGLNKMSTSVRKAGRLSIRETYTAKASAINKAVTIQRSLPRTMTATIWGKGRPLALTSFSGTRPVKKGVVIKIKRSGKRTVLEGAFLQTVTLNRKGEEVRALVFRRRAKPRYPIHVLSGPDVAIYFGSKRTQRAMEREIDARLDRVMAHEIGFEIDRGFKRSGAQFRKITDRVLDEILKTR